MSGLIEQSSQIRTQNARLNPSYLRDKRYFVVVNLANALLPSKNGHPTNANLLPKLALREGISLAVVFQCGDFGHEPVVTAAVTDCKVFL